MHDVKLSMDGKGRGKFYIMDGDEQVAEMEVGVSGKSLTVYHTGVVPEQEGKGLAKELFGTMVDHARQNELNIIPLCPFVHQQFKRHPEEYADIWNKTGK